MGARAVMIMTVSIPVEMTDEFHRWYDEVHIPELLRIPGILGAQRFESVDDPKTFIAIYEMEHADVPASEAFRFWRETSQSTHEMAARFSAIERRVFRRIFPPA